MSSEKWLVERRKRTGFWSAIRKIITSEDVYDYFSGENYDPDMIRRGSAHARRQIFPVTIVATVTECDPYQEPTTYFDVRLIYIHTFKTSTPDSGLIFVLLPKDMDKFWGVVLGEGRRYNYGILKSVDYHPIIHFHGHIAAVDGDRGLHEIGLNQIVCFTENSD